ncbi:class II aldolase/adducin family protein [Herbiconiux sp.]|uniref:class II aldolase/adducin family protein n=1 Tax=Herbiconiux sp. TaxID=1871186 RepID=UPI0025C5CB32|nr:class II aldolase/adducin family protein [Herbiconiux sp.]
MTAADAPGGPGSSGHVLGAGVVDDASLTAAGLALAAESARFAGLGWMPGTAGNLSVTLARDPLRLAVTASGLDKGELTASDIVLIDGDGEWVPDAPGVPGGSGGPGGSGEPGGSGVPDGDGVATGRLGDAVDDHPASGGFTERLGLARRPSAEAGLHARIAAVTGAGAVIHVHALAAVRAAHAWPEGVVLHDLEMLKGIGHSAHGERVVLPVVQNHQDMRVLGDDFERVYLRPTAADPAAGTSAVAEVPALLVASHGIYAWGADLRQARWHLELTEALLQIALATR